MGKTYKRLGTFCHRKPKGHKQAIINDVRKKAIPPSSWEDINFDEHCYLPYRIAQKLFDDGWSIEDIEYKIKFKFKLKPFEVKQVLDCLV